MDTQKDCQNPRCGGISPQPGQRIVVGARQLRKALLSGRAQKVFLARNADPTITEPIAALCREHQVRCVWMDAMTDLGHACGIDVGAAAAAVVA